MNNIKIDIIVVTYNRLYLLKDCISHLINQEKYLYHIYIINNNSTDGTKQYLNKINNKLITPITLHRNLGGAGGFSYGLRYAYENSSASYFLIMDDDTLVTDKTFLPLINSIYYLSGNFGYLSSNVRYWKDKSPALLNVPVVTKDWNYLAYNKLIKLRSASFVSLLVPRFIIKRVGLPISEMFIWADDVEYTTRISKQIPSYFVSNSIVVHRGESNNNNESVMNVNLNRLLYYKCMFRNRLYIYRKYYGYKYFIVKLLEYILILCEIPFKAKNHKIKRMLYTFLGILKGLIFNPKIRFPKK